MFIFIWNITEIALAVFRFTFHYVYIYISTVGAVIPQAVDIYIPLCLYLYCLTESAVKNFFRIYIPLCLYLYVDAEMEKDSFY